MTLSLLIIPRGGAGKYWFITDNLWKYFSHKMIMEHVFLFQSMVEQCAADDPDTEINLGCLLYKVMTYLECTLCLKLWTHGSVHLLITSEKYWHTFKP